MDDEFTILVPGRVCMLGDNTDLIKEPAIAATISCHLHARFSQRDDDLVIVHSNDIKVTEQHKKSELGSLESPLKYVNAVLQEFHENLEALPYGFSCEINSDIPLGAGLSSSTALVIAAIKGIVRLCGMHLSAKEIAETSYRIESKKLHIECGRMDQYAIAHEGISFIETGDHPFAERIKTGLLEIVVADSQETHDTKALQTWILERIDHQDATLLDALNSVSNLVKSGKTALERYDLKTFGALMDKQQELELIMGTSTQRLELLCSTARKAGALGAKQMGAGGGGCIVALCTESSIDEVARSLQSKGAPVWSFTLGK